MSKESTQKTRGNDSHFCVSPASSAQFPTVDRQNSKKLAENQRESDDKMWKMATGVALGGLFSLGALRHLHDLIVRNAEENSRKRAIK